MRDDVKNIIDFFAGKYSVLGRDLNRLILELSGVLKVGKHSVSYVTHHLPSFFGKVWKRSPPFDKRLYFLNKDHQPLVIYHHRKKDSL